MGPRKEKRKGALSYTQVPYPYPGSRPETGEGGCALPVVLNALFLIDSQPAAVL